MPVKKGDKVKVEYKGTLEDGTVFDTSEGKQPLEFEAGTGKVIKGFDDAIIGMKEGEEKEIKLSPGQAYGDHNPQLIKKVPKDKLPEGQEPKVGMMLALGTPDGKQFPAKITEIGDQDITLDLNHPLAGKDLAFNVKVVGVEEGKPEEEKEQKQEESKTEEKTSE